MNTEGAQKRILIIEENIEALTLVYTTLLPFDYQVEAALEVAEIRLRIERFQPDLVLIASEIADEAGISTLEWASDFFDMQVIIMGEPHKRTLPQFRKFFISDFLIKPVDPAQLLIKINNLLPV